MEEDCRENDKPSDTPDAGIRVQCRDENTVTNSYHRGNLGELKDAQEPVCGVVQVCKFRTRFCKEELSQLSPTNE
jgi:hypothetical protein